MCMNSIKKMFLSFSFLTLFSITYAQKIKLKITGEKDTTVFLVKYYGKGMYYADTAEIKKGLVEFDCAKQKPGVMAILLPGQRYFDFIFNNEVKKVKDKKINIAKKNVIKRAI